MEAKDLFLDKITKQINAGDFDKHLTIPFMTRTLLLTSIKSKVEKRVVSNGTPVLSDSDIKTCIKDARETAGETFSLFQKYGFFSQNDEGIWEISEKGKKALKQSFLL